LEKVFGFILNSFKQKTADANANLLLIYFKRNKINFDFDRLESKFSSLIFIVNFNFN